ncbi:outer membrane beta-barrel protein [Salinimicrobium sediminilitoris]|uniref:outer membrane beta-barrel protein n=1 Tax=Salinimicrobium sediminilitoris TaxID=2876715 RepID=UPI001E42E448|nr:outer membrane beta-barrel protein [Salinimicrobium sediminilitoris]MCC8361175.1 outer membrane beta-barrel protein [Salinimicrobium sediminilitoris]
MTKRLLVIVFILFSVITTAQERTSSPYSFYGLGLNTFKGTVENRSMGGLSILSDSIHVNLQNPAALGRLGLTTYTVGLSNTSVEMKTQDQSESNNTTSLDYLAVGIPAGKLGFAFGLVPYSAVGYNIFDMDREGGVANRYSGKGGINQVFLAAGYAITPNINLGAEASYNFGNIQNKSIFIQEDVQLGSREINRSDLYGFTYKIGLDYERMLSEKLQFKMGAHYTPETTLEAENMGEIATLFLGAEGQEITIDTRDIDIPDSDFVIPSSLGVGAGIGQPKKWFVGAEYVTTAAGDYSNRAFTIEGASFEQAAKYKIGGYYIPNYNSLTNYFNRIVYRGGLRMEETGLHLNGESINEFGIAFGLGLPAGRMLTNINLGLEYGQRGTTSSGLIQENYFNAMISFSLNDKWFIKRRFE